MVDKESRIVSRRRVLEVLGVGGTLGIAGCGQQRSKQTPTTKSTTTTTENQTEKPTVTETETETETETTREKSKEWDVEPLQHDKIIGAHYYPWYRPEEEWIADTPLDPQLGEYSSRDEDVINQHIKWAVEHGINWFPISWAEGRNREEWIENHFLKTELALEIDFSVRYESPTIHNNREQIDFDNPRHKQKLVDTLGKIERKYFDESNYLYIQDQPVVHLFGADRYQGDVRGALATARSQLEADPFIIADVVGWIPPLKAKTFIDQVEAITTYMPYVASVWNHDDFEESLKITAKHYREWQISAEEENTKFIPSALPGYNDSRTRPNGGPELKRSPDRFKSFLEKVMDYMDPVVKTLQITSFNEWPESTAIEPTKDKGNEYLEVLANQSRNHPNYVDNQHLSALTLEFDHVKDTGEREIALMAGRVDLESGNTKLASYDIGGNPLQEPYYTEGAFFQEFNDNLEIEDWRWLGGPTKRAKMYFSEEYISKTDRITIYGAPIQGEELKTTISKNGQEEAINMKGKAPKEYMIDF